MLNTELCNKDIWAWIFTALEAFFIHLNMLKSSVEEKMKMNGKDQGWTQSCRTKLYSVELLLFSGTELPEKIKNKQIQGQQV